MSETKLEALEWRWRISQSVDDELEYLQERARCGEPRRRPPGAPLRTRIEALAGLYAVGDRQALLAGIAAERHAAGPIWFHYWDNLYAGLDPSSERYPPGMPGHSYRRAIALMPLNSRHGRPLAKVILRDLAPRYPSLPLPERRIVRLLGAGLDPREDLDARSLLIDLIDRWDIDGKSQNYFLRALSRAGLDVCLPVLERRLSTSVRDKETALGYLTTRSETAPSAALRAAIATWKDPSWLVFQLVYRGDREATPALRAALKRLPPGGPGATLIADGLKILAREAPVSASALEAIHDRMYRRHGVDLSRFDPMVTEPPAAPKARQPLAEQLLERARRAFEPQELCEQLDDLQDWHGLDPRLTSELALVVLAAAAREDPRPEFQNAARRVIWAMGLLEIEG